MGGVIAGFGFMVLLFGVMFVIVAAQGAQANGERRDHEDWLERRREAAKKAVAESKAAYDDKFADARDPSPEARKMRFAISQARNTLKAVEQEQREFSRPQACRKGRRVTAAPAMTEEEQEYELFHRYDRNEPL